MNIYQGPLTKDHEDAFSCAHAGLLLRQTYARGARKNITRRRIAEAVSWVSMHTGILLKGPDVLRIEAELALSFNVH